MMKRSFLMFALCIAMFFAFTVSAAGSQPASGEINVRVLDKNNEPVINARVRISSPKNSITMMERGTNGLGEVKLIWDMSEGAEVYSAYNVVVEMPRPNGLEPIIEEFPIKIAPKYATKIIEVKLKNASTHDEFKKATPRVEITVRDHAGKIPVEPIFFMADVINTATPDIGGYRYKYESYLDNEGKIYFVGMEPERYSLFMDKTSWGQKFTFDVPAGENLTKLAFTLLEKDSVKITSAKNNAVLWEAPNEETAQKVTAMLMKQDEKYSNMDIRPRDFTITITQNGKKSKYDFWLDFDEENRAIVGMESAVVTALNEGGSLETAVQYWAVPLDESNQLRELLKN